MGGADHHVRPGEGVHPQEGQVCPMSPIHNKTSPISVYHVGNFLDITQQSAITWRCNTNRFYFRVFCQCFFHRFRGNCGRQPLLLPPGPWEVDRLQVQQGQGVVHRPVAPPVDEHPVPGAAAEGQRGVEPQCGAAGEELTAVHGEVLRPQPLGGVEGLPAMEQVPGGAQLGHIQGGRPR